MTKPTRQIYKNCIHLFKNYNRNYQYVSSVTNRYLSIKNECPNPQDDFIKKIAFVRGKKGQKNVITQFMKKYYLPHDPLLKSAGLSKNEEFLKFLLKDLREELTVLAVDPRKGKILGIAINDINYPDTPSIMKKEAASDLKDKTAFRVACLFADVMDKSKLFQRFDINVMVECAFLATHPDSRNHGLGKHLVLQSRQLARNAGFPLLRMDCTSHFSSRIAKRIQMERLPTRQVVDYVDDKGQPWVSSNPPPPDSKLEICFDRLVPGLVSKFPPPPPMPTKKKKRFFFF